MITKKMYSAIVFAVAALATGASAAEFETDFDGAWRGNLQMVIPLVDSNALPDVTELPEFLEFAIQISDDAARVYVFWDGSWDEVKPGSFGAVSHKTNSIVAATDSLLSVDGRVGWVETWNFTITAKDDDSLYAYWVRAVNNPHLSDDSSPDARFFMSRFGTLHRSDPVFGANKMQVSTVIPDSVCRQKDLACGDARKRLDRDLETNEKIE